MLALFRIDSRLLHFQTSKVWPAKLGVDTIVVANDQVVGDALRTSLMRMSAPSTCSLEIVSVDEAIGRLSPGGDLASRIVELLVDSTDDALRVVRGLPGVAELDVALLPGGEGRTMVTPSLGLAESDFENLRAIVAAGVDAQAYVTPEDRRVSVASLV